MAKFEKGERVYVLSRPPENPCHGRIINPEPDARGEVGVQFDFYPVDDSNEVVEYGHPEDDLAALDGELLPEQVEQARQLIEKG